MRRPVPPLLEWQPPLARTRRRRRRPIFLGTGIGLALLCFAAALDLAVRPAPRVIWNASASAPIGFWRIHPDRPIHTGDMVLARTPDAVRQLACAATIRMRARVASREDVPER